MNLDTRVCSPEFCPCHWVCFTSVPKFHQLLLCLASPEGEMEAVLLPSGMALSTHTHTHHVKRTAFPTEFWGASSNFIPVMGGPSFLFPLCFLSGSLEPTSYLMVCARVHTAQGHVWRWLVFTRVFQELLQVLAAMSLHPAGLHWSHSMSSQGHSTGVRQLLCSLGLCSVSEAAASSELLCTSNLTRTPGWPVTWLGLELQGGPK